MNQNEFEERSIYLNGSLYNLDPRYTENKEIDLINRNTITLIR